MKPIHKKLTKSLTWNTVESLAYNGLMMGHQWALLKCTSFSMIGLIGSIFSIIYLSVACIDLGMEASLAPFFSIWSSSRQSFKRFVAVNSIPTLALGPLVPLLFFIGHIHFSFLSTITHHINTTTTFFIIATIFLESSRKLCKTILQIAFQNKMHTILEVGMIFSYIACVWSAYFLGMPISVPLIFGSLFCVSLFATLGSALWVARWYMTLAHTSPAQPLPVRRIIKNRFFSFLHRTGTLLFSANFIVPLFALRFDLHYAGLLRFASNMTHNVTSIIHRIFSASGNALLAHARTHDNKTQQQLFGSLTHKLNHVLYALAIFFVINYRILFGIHNAPTDYMGIALFALCFIMQITESFGLAFEKLFIVYEKAEILFLTTFITLTTLGVLLYTTHSIAPLTLLFVFAVTRTLSLVLLHVIASRSWKMQAFWRASPTYLIASLIISLTFFFTFH